MRDHTPCSWRQVVRKRAIGVAVGFALWAVAIEVRLVHLQVVQRADLQAQADRAQKRRFTTAARRGEILDRHGRVLAYSVDSDSIYAVPTVIENAQEVAATLCGVFSDCTPGEVQSLAERLGRRKAFAWVRRQVSPAVAKRIEELRLAGIGFLKEPRRFYPNRELAAHLVGYVGVDSDGLGGIEATYDRQIRGQPGTILVQADEKRHAFSRVGEPPVVGATLELTIDVFLQHIAERELGRGVAATRAAGGTAIIMDPQTGEILALANEPTFNPNDFRDSDERERRNRAVQDLYEPGSTFKVVTASAAIEEHVLTPADTIDVSSGAIRLGSRLIEDVHRYGVLSFADVIVKSSNVGAVKVGMRLGAERLGRYVHRFGFGTRLSPDFPAENAGIVWDPGSWTDSALASVAMGYQIGVTPLQMATAVSTVANGGELVQPRVVRALIRDNVRAEVPHRTIRRATSEATAAELTAIMEGVVERGTAQAAQIPGFTVAGKTGTAAKLVNGKYSQSDYNASFVGFVPSRKPALTILVVIDSPRGGQYFGGTVAAPIFKRIAEASLQYLGTSPTVNPPPAILVARRSGAPEVRMSAGLENSAIVPAPTGADNNGSGLPELRGLGAREAIRVLARTGATARLSGSGIVIGQDPPAGTPVEPGVTCRLSLGRPPARTSVNGLQP